MIASAHGVTRAISARSGTTGRSTHSVKRAARHVMDRSGSDVRRPRSRSPRSRASAPARAVRRAPAKRSRSSSGRGKEEVMRPISVLFEMIFTGDVPVFTDGRRHVRPREPDRRARSPAPDGARLRARGRRAAGRGARPRGQAQRRRCSAAAASSACSASPSRPSTAAPAWTRSPRSSSTTSSSKSDPGFALAYLAHAMLFVNNFYWAGERRAARALPAQGAHRRVDRRHGHDRARRAAPTCSACARPRAATATTSSSTGARRSSPTRPRPTSSSSTPRSTSASPRSSSSAASPASPPTRRSPKMGMRASTMSEIQLDDCVVPAENVLGTRGRRHQAT